MLHTPYLQVTKNCSYQIKLCQFCYQYNHLFTCGILSHFVRSGSAHCNCDNKRSTQSKKKENQFYPTILLDILQRVHFNTFSRKTMILARSLPNEWISAELRALNVRNTEWKKYILILSSGAKRCSNNELKLNCNL